MNLFLTVLLLSSLLQIQIVESGILSFMKGLLFRSSNKNKTKHNHSSSKTIDYNDYYYNSLLNEITELKDSNALLSNQVTSLKTSINYYKNQVTVLKKENSILRNNFVKLEEKHNTDIREITDALVKKLEEENNNNIINIKQKHEQEVVKIKKEFNEKYNVNASKSKSEIRRLLQSKEQSENELIKVKELLRSKRNVSINRLRLSKEEKYDDSNDSGNDNDSEERPRSWSYTSKPPSKKVVVKRGRGRY